MSFKQKQKKAKAKKDTASKTSSGSSSSSSSKPTPKESTPAKSTAGIPKKSVTKTTPLKKSIGSTSSVAGQKRKAIEGAGKSSEGSRKKPTPPPIATLIVPREPSVVGLKVGYTGVISAMRKSGRGPFIDALIKQLTGADDRRGSSFADKHYLSDRDAVEWLMRAVCVYAENADLMKAGGLAVDAVVPRLIKAATSPARTSFTLSRDTFEMQVIRVGGWAEVRFRNRLAEPSPGSMAKLREIYFTDPVSSTTTTTVATVATVPRIGPLRKDVLAEQLRIDLSKLVAHHVARFKDVEPRPMASIKAVADLIQTWMASDFGGVFLANPDSPYHTGVRYSERLVSSESRDVSTKGLTDWLKNRSDIVGNRKGEPAAYKLASYNPARKADQQAREEILADLLKSGEFRADVTRAVQTTGCHSPGKGQVSITPFIPKRGKSAYLWRQSRTLIHEFLHFLTHEEFRTVAHGTDHGQVMIEGITEVLTAEVFRRFADHVSRNPSARRLVLGDEPYSAPPGGLFEIGYEDAGKQAEVIRKEVGLDNVEAAYFLGMTAFIGVTKEDKRKETR